MDLKVEVRGLGELERMVHRLTYAVAAIAVTAVIALAAALVLWATS